MHLSCSTTPPPPLATRFVVTTDKDRKARVSVLPAAMQHGSVEIQSYCLGHRHFVSTSTFVVQGGLASGGPAMLVTGACLYVCA